MKMGKFKDIIFIFLVFGLLSITKSVKAQGKTDRPNVIFILTDDQGYGDLACHGNPYIKTPNLDKFHDDSVRFTDFHVAPTCAPTRAMLMTGMYPSRVGVWHTVKGRSLMDKDYMTVADLFNQNGYETGFFGKWHLGDNYPYRPEDRGFNEVVALGGGGVGNVPDYWGNDYFDDTYYHNGIPEKYDGYCTDVFFNEGLEFIKNSVKREKPFFAYIPTNAPHLPFVVAKKYREMYPNIEDGLQEFYGMITNIDDNIGKLRDKLTEWGIADNTILIFMTDNGSSRGFHKYNAGMRGGKGTVWDGGHRVPFFIYWPDKNIKGGRDINELTSGVDIMPTLSELCHLKGGENNNYDGKSLVPLINNNKWEERILVDDNQRVTYPRYNRRSVVMTKQWRFLNGNELYDIKQDPAQNKDIAELHPEVVKTLKAKYDEWWKDVYGNIKPAYEITIGSGKENPTRLTSHDLNGSSVWNQDEVLAGTPCGGYWEIFVAQDGEYEFSLRRFPKEFDHGISSTPMVPADLKYLQYHQPEHSYAVSNYAAKEIYTTGAQLVVGNHFLDKEIPLKAKKDDINYDTDPDGFTSAVNFRVNLKKGSTRLSSWFVDEEDDGAMHGVYYVYVTKL